MTIDKRRRGLIIGAILLLLMAPAPWFVKLYWAKPIEGWVVDAQTGQPLEGVNVVAHWALEIGMGQHDLVLTETVTDPKGRYYFPGWGPKKVPWRMPLQARLENFDPEIIFFKDGYEWQAVFNDRPGSPSGMGPWVRDSLWDGKQIRLKRFTGPASEYGSFTSGLLTGVSYGGCGWTRIPRMMVTLITLAERLSKERSFNYLPTREDLENTSEKKDCRPIDKYLPGLSYKDKNASSPYIVPAFLPR